MKRSKVFERDEDQARLNNVSLDAGESSVDATR
jgi:hypothetical protein